MLEKHRQTGAARRPRSSAGSTICPPQRTQARGLDLNAVIRDAVGLIEPMRASAACASTSDLADGLPQVRADR
jgi:hypothetical protein